MKKLVTGICLVAALSVAACKSTDDGTSAAAMNTVCPLSGMAIDEDVTRDFGDAKVAFCCNNCATKWDGMTDADEIIASVDKGIYAPNFGGGQVDITSGKFVFSASEAYLIENGKVSTPVKGAMLIGDGPEVLHKISMVGNDLELDSGVGTCGKEGQSVPVGVGQPTLKIDELTVGGTA